MSNVIALIYTSTGYKRDLVLSHFHQHFVSAPFYFWRIEISECDFLKKLFLNFKKYVFLYLWLCRVFIAVSAFSPHSEWGLLSSCGVWASHFGGLSCCRAWAIGAQASVVATRGLRGCDSRALEYRLSSCGITPWRVESSLTRNPTCVPCIGSGFFTTRSPSMWFSFALCS